VLAVSLPAFAAQLTTVTTHDDPHYTERGFFDIHVCNWPNRPLFFMILFSTHEFAALEKVTVYDPRGREVTTIGLARYRLVQQKGKPEKRVFISQWDIADGAENGWYSAQATFTDGRSITARDYVVIESMQRAKNVSPTPDAEDVPMPRQLSWDPVPGARYYQVFIKDVWEDGKLIHTSKLLAEPRLVLPQGLLNPGGMYTWRIHARDTNENIILGDFNHGSLTGEFAFTTADE
jgi:hypothetical protein